MIIYIDVLIIVNFILDFILLMGVRVILTRNVLLKRVILGSLVGSLSIIVLFINISKIWLLLLKILLGFFMVIVCFGYKNLKYTFNNFFYLLNLSFIVGGIMYLLMDMMVYNYLILLISFLVVCYLYTRQVRKYQGNYSNYYQVEVYYHNKKYLCTGFLDTGNKLYDNYKSRPIVLVYMNIEYDLNDVIYVPFETVNNSGVLWCLKADKIIVNNHIFNNYLIGLSNNKIHIDGVNCLLHSKMKGEL